ncbi:hypothetical protein [Aquisalimonas sp.]|uniref:hypothetical protein n=1 Tax=Aquisalimonas sp. TaxID=1872621 RepID=UPI0025C61521|nr:hypothetical protein [Aquisalimonas sp.]
MVKQSALRRWPVPAALVTAYMFLVMLPLILAAVQGLEPRPCHSFLYTWAMGVAQSLDVDGQGWLQLPLLPGLGGLIAWLELRRPLFPLTAHPFSIGFALR